MAPFDAADLTALAPYECYWRVPAPQGPLVVSARTSPLPDQLRDDAGIAELSSRLRLSGNAQAAPPPEPPWKPT